VKQASIYRLVDRAGFCSSNVHQNDQLGPTIRTFGNFLALLCLIFGIAFTAYIPALLEQRIGSLFFFGLIPAAGFYVGSHILSHLLVVGRDLCEMIAARCFRCFVFLVKSFLIWVGPHVSGVSIGCLMLLAHCRLSKLSDLSQKTCRSIRHRCWRAHTAFIEYLCLLIRSGARFVIRMQASHARSVPDVPRGGWGLWPLIRKGMLLTAFGLAWCGGHYIWLLDLKREDPAGGAAIDAVVERIIGIKSDGAAIDAVVEI
jgi:hypothetical protein